MTFQIATAHATGPTETAVQSLVKELQSQIQAPKLVIFFASTQQSVAAVAQGLTAAFASATVIGCSSAGEFRGRQEKKGSLVATAIGGDLEVRAGFGGDLKANPERAVAEALASIPSASPHGRYRTGIVLLDPLAGNGEETALLVSSMLGPDTPLAGGAAGDDLAMKETIVAAGKQVGSNAVVVAMLYTNVPLGIGVAHAHRPWSNELKVTKATGGTVNEIDGQPAWLAWKETARAKAKEVGIDIDTLSGDALGAFLLRFEAGLATGGDRYKVRAPLAVDAAQGITFACGIPEGASLRIMESSPQEQISSAQLAARLAKGKMNTVAGALVFDCICRNLILGGEFKNAVSSILAELGTEQVAGFETYGEIALNVGDTSGFHNTTTVVVAFPG